MHSPTQSKSVTCEQCGAPMKRWTGEEGCLSCLLGAGLEVERAEDFTPPNEPGTRFFQHYEILTRPDGSRWELGRGAMGVTYKARDVNLDTPVALKIINARFSGRPEARRRFLHEARLAARLRHPNVASVFHFGTNNASPSPNDEPMGMSAKVDAGDCFYAMEFIEGESLETRLRRNGPLHLASRSRLLCRSHVLWPLPKSAAWFIAT